VNYRPAQAWPDVLDEDATLEQLHQGRSIARYGDGEFKMCEGNGIKSQNEDASLSAELARILYDPGDCLVGIPNITPATIDRMEIGQKKEFWEKQRRFLYLLEDGRSYVSSFITRPDSAPWINRAKYWARLEQLWIDQEVTLVRGSGKSLTGEDLIGAGMVTEIIGPRQHAWSARDELLERIGRPKRVLLCLGPSATALAVRLCRVGVQAIDLGHVGMFLRKHRRGDPMWVTEGEKDIDRRPAGDDRDPKRPHAPGKAPRGLSSTADQRR